MRLSFLIEGFEFSSTAAHQASGRLSSRQSDDPRAFQLRKARLAPGTEPISKTIYALAVEAVEAGAYGLGVAAQFLGDCGGAKSLPAQSDDPGSRDPVAGSMAASGQFVDLLLFFSIFGRAGTQQFRHGLLPSRSAFRPRAYVYRL